MVSVIQKVISAAEVFQQLFAMRSPIASPRISLQALHELDFARRIL